MGLMINTNLASLQGRNQVERNSAALNTTLQRLSSGLRINASKDDAAGMAVAETLTSRIRGNDVALRNANDGISMAQTAEGALTQVITNYQRIRDIAVQSTSSALGDTDRSKLQTEVDQLTQEISRIIQTTEFNGQTLISGGSTMTFLVGASSSGVGNATIAFSAGQMDGLSAIGALSTDMTATGTINVNASANASAAISALDNALSTLITERAKFGAIQNRFDAVVAQVKTYNENMTAARSRIQDADFASETANLTKQQILSQSGMAMLAQANQSPQMVLTLLR